LLLCWIVPAAVAAGWGAWQAGIHAGPRGSWVLFAVGCLAATGAIAAFRSRRSPMHALVAMVSALLLTAFAAILWLYVLPT
jgi:hypothetical protein